MKKRMMALVATLIFSIIILLSSCAPSDLNTVLKDIDQNIFSYLDSNTENQLLIPQEKQKNLMEDYLKHFFSPWENEDKETTLEKENKIKEIQYQLIDKFKKNPGWAQNYQPHSISWIEAIEKNMDLSSFPNNHRKAITIENIHLRMLPTQKPTFSNLKEAGQGFPFDNFQITLLPNNLPILVLHTSKDKAWHFVLSHNAFGWMPSNQLAFTDKTFIHRWKTGQYVTPSLLEIPLKNTSQFYFYLRLGHLYPTHSNSAKEYSILIAQKDLNHKAVIKSISVEKELMHKIPIPITPHHIALLANEMIGQPYGWGGLFDYRDCSSTMADLFAPFGIWLPRNSSDQLNAWRTISLSGLKNSEKKKLIEKKGIPMLTLLGWPGHIMLYIGIQHHQIYTFHTAWGLQTTLLLSKKTGRAIFGKTVITPVNLGSKYFNIKATLLDKVASMTFLGELKEESEE